MVKVITKYLKGKTKVPFLGNTPNTWLAVGGLALLVGGYLLYQNGNLNIFGGGTGEGVTNTAPVDSIYVKAVPDKVRPNDYITLAGVFLDNSKQPTLVNTGYYRVVEDDNTGKGTQSVKASGVVGNNIAQFVIQISTNGYQDGKSYSVEVSDSPEFL